MDRTIDTCVDCMVTILWPRVFTSCIAKRLDASGKCQWKRFRKSQTLRLNIKIKTHNAFFAYRWSMCAEFRSVRSCKASKSVEKRRKDLTSTILRRWFVFEYRIVDTKTVTTSWKRFEFWSSNSFNSSVSDACDFNRVKKRVSDADFGWHEVNVESFN